MLHPSCRHECAGNAFPSGRVLCLYATLTVPPRNPRFALTVFLKLLPQVGILALRSWQALHTVTPLVSSSFML